MRYGHKKKKKVSKLDSDEVMELHNDGVDDYCVSVYVAQDIGEQIRQMAFGLGLIGDLELEELRDEEMVPIYAKGGRIDYCEDELPSEQIVDVHSAFEGLVADRGDIFGELGRN